MNFSEINDDCKTVKCPFPSCSTKIIPYTEALRTSILKVPNAPSMVNVESSDIDFFKVNDMWDFDNIGVSRPMNEAKDFKVDDKNFSIERLLICSECDKGPIGFAGHFEGNEDPTPNNLIYYLSCNSVLYQ